MRIALTALLSLAVLFIVLVSNEKDDYTIHIGARTPPTDAKCHQIGVERTDDGRLLGIYSCPA